MRLQFVSTYWELESGNSFSVLQTKTELCGWNLKLAKCASLEIRCFILTIRIISRSQKTLKDWKTLNQGLCSIFLKKICTCSGEEFSCFHLHR